MKLAVEAVRTRHMSVYGAAKHFSVPFETLRKQAHGIVAEDAKPGHPTVLTKDEEMEIVETCQIFAEWGFGLRRQDILQVVTDFCQKTKRKILSVTESLAMVGGVDLCIAIHNLLEDDLSNCKW